VWATPGEALGGRGPVPWSPLPTMLTLSLLAAALWLHPCIRSLALTEGADQHPLELMRGWQVLPQLLHGAGLPWVEADLCFSKSKCPPAGISQSLSLRGWTFPSSFLLVVNTVPSNSYGVCPS
jgi:hypothetical protein